MKVLLRIGAVQKFFLTFPFFKASLIVESLTISKSLNRFLQRGRVTGA